MLLAVLLLARANWPVLLSTLSISYIADYHVAPWGVLALAALMTYAKRSQIGAAMAPAPAPVLMIAGLVIVCLAWLVPATDTFFVLRLLAGWAGVFTVCFGAAAIIPLILLAAYAFAIYFPWLIETYLDASYAHITVAPVAWLLHLFGLQIATSGQLFQFLTPARQPMTIAVSSACAGPATMAVFVVIFTIMMLDMPLSWQGALPVFLFGVIGTWLQNVIRVIIILGCGYYLGADALWTAHFWTIYALFPLWYLLFAVVYFRFAPRPPALRPTD